MSAGIVVKSFSLMSLQNGMNRVEGRGRDAVKKSEEETLATCEREGKV